MNYLVFFAFVAIIASLGCALFFLMKSDSAQTGRSQKMARALALRVGLSIVLFASILLAWKFGLIHPTGIRSGQ